MALDPRLRAIVETVNGVVASRAIRHAYFMRGVENGIGRKINRFLKDEVVPDLLRKIENIGLRSRGFASAPWTTQRYKDLTKATWNILRTGMDKAEALLVGDLKELAVYEAEFQKALIDKSVPIEMDFVTPPKVMLKAIVRSQPIQGQVLKTAFTDVAKRTQTEMHRQIRMGLAQGESIPQMVRRLRGTRAAGYKDGVLTEKFPRQAEMIARTATNQVVNQASLATFEENDDIVDRWRYVATLDTRTCPMCGPLDGQVYDMADRQFVPPRHPNCRCKVVSVLKVTEEFGDMDVMKVPGLERASADGPIPLNTSYGDWVGAADYKTQVAALGRGRADLLRGGKVGVKDLISREGRTIPLSRLKTMDGLALSK